MTNFSPTIYFGGGSGTTALLIIYLLIKYPDHVKKWIGILSRFLNYIFKKSDYFSTKWEIEGKLNSFAADLETDGGVPYNRLSIKWTARREDEAIVFEDGQTIIVMRDKNHRNKNFVHAAYFYTSKILLDKVKRKLNKENAKNLKLSLDLFTTQKIIQKENKSAMDQFVNDFLYPETNKSDELKKYIERFKKIDTVGLFFPILIQELTYLGNKIHLTTPTDEILTEIKNLIFFLENWSERQVGQNIQEDFLGKYTKCSIKIVASHISRELDRVEQQRNRVCNAFSHGCENVYVIGNAEIKSKKFINKVVEAILIHKPNLKVVKSDEFIARIKGYISRIPTPNYLVHIHNPEAVEHIYE